MNLKLIIIISILISCQSEKQKRVFEKDVSKLDSLNDTISDQNFIINNKYIRIKDVLYPLDKIDKYKISIKKYSDTYNIDWLLIVSQILKESHFDKDAESHVGAKGLMQIMPNTKGDLSKDLDIEYIFERPKENIKAGIYHLSNQYDYFNSIDNYEDRIKVALAAYNCGPGRLIDAMKLARFEGLDDKKWENIKQTLKKLKRTDYELHLNVWPDGKPKHGYFYNFNEPISYVDTIWELYQILQKISI